MTHEMQELAYIKNRHEELEDEKQSNPAFSLYPESSDKLIQAHADRRWLMTALETTLSELAVSRAGKTFLLEQFNKLQESWSEGLRHADDALARALVEISQLRKQLSIKGE